MCRLQAQALELLEPEQLEPELQGPGLALRAEAQHVVLVLALRVEARHAVQGGLLVQAQVRQLAELQAP